MDLIDIIKQKQTTKQVIIIQNKSESFTFLNRQMKLYSPANNYKLDSVLLASRILGKEVEHVEIPYDHRNKQFLAQYPYYSLPALQIDHKQFVFGTHSILLALFDQKITKMSSFVQSDIHQWLQTLQKEVENAIGFLIAHRQRIDEKTQINQEQLKKAKQTVQKFMKTVDERLKLRTYLCENSITPADISIFSCLRMVKEYFFIIKSQFDEKEWKNLVCLRRWMSNLQGIRLNVLKK